MPLLPSRCYRCGAATKDHETCKACRHSTKLKHVWVACSYDGVVKDLVRVHKFERALSAAQAIADITVSALPFIPRDTFVVPVPTATTRIRMRGYDHALLLAKNISRKQGLVYGRPIIRKTQSRQVGSSRSERFKQLEGAFSVVRREDVAGRRILLVDDVITTGATLETLAHQLKDAGAQEVNAVACAQKL